MAVVVRLLVAKINTFYAAALTLMVLLTVILRYKEFLVQLLSIKFLGSKEFCQLWKSIGIASNLRNSNDVPEFRERKKCYSLRYMNKDFLTATFFFPYLIYYRKPS